MISDLARGNLSMPCFIFSDQNSSCVFDLGSNDCIK